MTVIDITFLYGFCPGTPEDAKLPGNALRIVGDTESIRITKGPQFDEWAAETISVVHSNLRDETPYNVLNRQKVHAIIDAWLDDVEFEG
jgi:hypothetical protein